MFSIFGRMTRTFMKIARIAKSFDPQEIFVKNIRKLRRRFFLIGSRSRASTLQRTRWMYFQASNDRTAGMESERGTQAPTKSQTLPRNRGGRIHFPRAPALTTVGECIWRPADFKLCLTASGISTAPIHRAYTLPPHGTSSKNRNHPKLKGGHPLREGCRSPMSYDGGKNPTGWSNAQRRQSVGGADEVNQGTGESAGNVYCHKT
ncbi:hypothetical protein DFH06DRAFT_58530 [Mycena polygramma]|nr:hypothetical protein DFH06DRAFT_58530 [Mycena polygramma]